MCAVKSAIVGLDIGGTAVKAALISSDGDIIRRSEMSTADGCAPEHFADRLSALCIELAQGAALQAVGIAIAGVIDPERTVLIESPNMPHLNSMPLRRMLEQRLGCPVRIENDANAAALGEYRRGAGCGLCNFLFFTLGTGIGSGLILNGCLWIGEQGKAGEFGHVTVDPDGALCGCGKRGCLEAHSSGTAIVRMAREAALHNDDTALRVYADNPAAITPEIVYQCAIAGDAASRLIFKSMARGLATAISDVNNLLDIHVFIAGGGISRAYDLFCPMIMEEIDLLVFSPSRGRIRLLRAELGNDAGVYGAGCLALDAAGRGSP